MTWRFCNRISGPEKDAWDKRVDVNFQKNAWMDGKTACAWLETTLAKHVDEQHSDDEEILLLCDNVSSHRGSDFKTLARTRCKSLLQFLPPNETDALQAVDAGYGQSVKTAMTAEQDKWLMIEDNFQRWEKNELTAMERRILLSCWFAEALETVNARSDTVFRYHEKVGNLMDIEDRNDPKIRPECAPATYTFPYPSTTDQEAVIALTTAEVGHEEQDDAKQLENCEDEADPPSDGDETESDDGTVADGSVPADIVEDQQNNWDEMVNLVTIAGLRQVENPYSRNFIGMKVMIKWDFGWQIGTVLKRAHSTVRTRGKNFEILYG